MPLLIFANKQDLECRLEVDEIIDKLELDKIKNRQWNIIATSAIRRTGIIDGFIWLKDVLNSKLQNNK